MTLNPYANRIIVRSRAARCRPQTLTLPRPVGNLLLRERVDEVVCGREPDLLAAVLNASDAECCGQLRFTSAGTADQHDVVGSVGKIAPVQMPDRGLVNLARGEIEAGQSLIDREPGRFDVVGDGADPRSAISALSNRNKVGIVASNAGAPCSTRSPTAWAMP